jgi:hypothetical protein
MAKEVNIEIGDNFDITFKKYNYKYKYPDKKTPR